jgi:hypothetical protein
MARHRVDAGRGGKDGSLRLVSAQALAILVEKRHRPGSQPLRLLAALLYLLT